MTTHLSDPTDVSYISRSYKPHENYIYYKHPCCSGPECFKRLKSIIYSATGRAMNIGVFKHSSVFSLFNPNSPSGTNTAYNRTRIAN